MLVIGAGPSGLATAIAAARSGGRVLLAEKHAGVSIFPKATGIRGRSMEIIRSWGLEDQVRAADMALPLIMAVAETLSQPAQEISLGLPPLGLSRTMSPTDVAVVPQDYLEPILLDHFHDVGGESRFGTELFSFGMDDELVRAERRSRDSGDRYRVRAVTSWEAIVGAVWFEISLVLSWRRLVWRVSTWPPCSRQISRRR